MNVELPETLVIIESIVYKSNGFAILNNIEHFYFYDLSIASYIIKIIRKGINAVYLHPTTLHSIRRLMPST